MSRIVKFLHRFPRLSQRANKQAYVNRKHFTVYNKDNPFRIEDKYYEPKHDKTKKEIYVDLDGYDLSSEGANKESPRMQTIKSMKK